MSPSPLMWLLNFKESVRFTEKKHYINPRLLHAIHFTCSKSLATSWPTFEWIHFSPFSGKYKFSLYFLNFLDNAIFINKTSITNHKTK